MSKNALFLLLQQTAADVEPIRQALLQTDISFRLVSVDHVATALARLAGGGVDLILLALSGIR